MYRNNNKIQQLAHGMLVITLLLGSSAMAEENLAQNPSAPAHVIDNLQRIVVESLTSQLQQSNEPLIAVEPVPVAPTVEWSKDMEAPEAQSPVQLAEDKPAPLRFTMQDWQPRENASERLSRVDG